MSEAIVAQRGPFAVELQAGRKVELQAGRKHAWCACGRSARQPFCDGSHQTTTLQPVIFKAERAGTAWLCGCKSTAERPFCDGSHDRP